MLINCSSYDTQLKLTNNLFIIKQCQSFHITLLKIFLYTYIDTPTPAPPSICFLKFSHPSLQLVLQWFSNFTSQNNVDKYNVTVTPDPSSCSNDQLRPAENYTCSGLISGTNYFISTNTIKCETVVGSSSLFNIRIECKSLSYVYLKWPGLYVKFNTLLMNRRVGLGRERLLKLARRIATALL